MEVFQNYNLQSLNTFGISAYASNFAVFNDVESLKFLIQNMPQQPLTILGGGSNMLLTRDISGTVLQNQIKGREVVFENSDEIHLRVGAGENWHDLVLFTVENDWGGIENLSLIPGCVGASPMQNIGAYGVEIKDVLISVEALHIPTLALHTFSNEDCEFGYRESVFKRRLKGQYVITHVTYRLTKAHQINSSYGAIGDVLQRKGIDTPTIRDISEAVIEIRSSKLPDPKQIGNAGSFFKNPVVSKSVLMVIQKVYPHVPFYSVDEEFVKIPAGWLIETAGWKGKDFGNYGVHDKQALVLVNRGGASGQSIFELSEQIIRDIQEKFEIALEREVNVY